MSKVTINICDIKDCRLEADSHIPSMLVRHQENGEGSFKIYTEKDVDLCGKHEFEYRSSLPDLKIERKGQNV